MTIRSHNMARRGDFANQPQYGCRQTSNEQRTQPFSTSDTLAMPELHRSTQ